MTGSRALLVLAAAVALAALAGTRTRTPERFMGLQRLTTLLGLAADDVAKGVMDSTKALDDLTKQLDNAGLQKAIQAGDVKGIQDLSKALDDVDVSSLPKEQISAYNALRKGVKETLDRGAKQAAVKSTKTLFGDIPMKSLTDLVSAVSKKFDGLDDATKAMIKKDGLDPDLVSRWQSKFNTSAGKTELDKLYKKMGLGKDGIPKNMGVREFVKKYWGWFSVAGTAVIGAFFLANEIRAAIEAEKSSGGGGGGGGDDGGGMFGNVPAPLVIGGLVISFSMCLVVCGAALFFVSQQSG